jgi:hypothetical protein
MLLEPEQQDLVATLVEATRRVPREDRYFVTIRSFGAADEIEGAGLDGPISAPSSDVDVLVAAGLLHVTGRQAASTHFVVSPSGFEFYEALKQRTTERSEQLEEDVQAYLDGPRFKGSYPTTYRLWSEAAELVWRADSANDLTTIGHKAREAMQAFATELVERHQPAVVNPDPTKTLDRISAVITMHRPQLGTARADFLDALFGYWRALNSIVQRQEHGAQKEGGPLDWEDGRRLVFHTSVVMTEIDRSL